MSAHHHRIDAAGVRLHAIEQGPRDAPWLVLLHGFTGACESLAGVADALADRWRVLRVDGVGHGRSEAPRGPAAYTMERCVEQLVALLEALRAPRAHWLGYSMGARAALALAVAHPERVVRMVLVGARAGFADLAERAARIRADEALAARIEREGVAAFVAFWSALPLFASQRRLGAAALARMHTQRLANRAHGLAGSLRGMGAGAQPPLHAALPGLRKPVLLAVGEEDAKFRAEAEALAAALPHSRLLTVPEAGHAAHLENPKHFLAATRRFLEGEDL